MEVTGQLHASSAFPVLEVSPVPNGQDAGWAAEPTGLDTWETRTPSCTCQDSNHSFLSVTMVTELSKTLLKRDD